MDAIEVRAMPIQDVVNNPEWQVVRKSLVGNWVRNHEHNVATLRRYLDRSVSETVEGWDDPLSVRRVLNVLVGTVHRVGHTANQPETDQLRLEVRVRWAELCGDPPYTGSGSIKAWGGTFA